MGFAPDSPAIDCRAGDRGRPLVARVLLAFVLGVALLVSAGCRPSPAAPPRPAAAPASWGITFRDTAAEGLLVAVQRLYLPVADDPPTGVICSISASTRVRW